MEISFTKTNEVLKVYKHSKFKDSVGNGWALILQGFFKSVEELVALGVKQPKIECIKEKFGGLRIYTNMDGKNDALDKIIQMAEDESRKICEFCGDSGKRFIFGFWQKTACAKCAEANNGEEPKTFSPVRFSGNFR